jgi:hypothetical protein
MKHQHVERKGGRFLEQICRGKEKFAGGNRASTVAATS